MSKSGLVQTDRQPDRQTDRQTCMADVTLECDIKLHSASPPLSYSIKSPESDGAHMARWSKSSGIRTSTRPETGRRTLHSSCPPLSSFITGTCERPTDTSALEPYQLGSTLFHTNLCTKPLDEETTDFVFSVRAGIISIGISKHHIRYIS